MLSSVYGGWMRTASLTTIEVSAQRVGRLRIELEYQVNEGFL
jgi:hypothetical protein